MHVDNIYGADVARYLADRRGPVALVVLRPSVDAVVAREQARMTTAYDPWIGDGRGLRDAVALFDSWIAATPGVGLWVDSSDLSAEDTVDHVLDRWSQARVPEATRRQLAENSATS